METTFHSGVRLKKFRNSQGWGQQRLADELKVDIRTIGRWEKDGIPDDAVRYVANWFGLKPWVLDDRRLSEDQFEQILADREAIPEIWNQIRPKHSSQKPSTSLASANKATPPKAWNPPRTPDPFIGRENDVINIQGALVVLSDVTEQRKSKIIAIHGVPGVGKSTLAAYLANDLKILSTFPDAVLWTSFGQFQTSDEANLEIKNRLKSWGELLGDSNIHRIVRLDDIADRLAIMLKNRKVLLLCDDVWDIDHISKVRRLVDGDISLVVTTRFTAIANTIPTYQDGVYELKVFSEKDAVRLLEIIAPKVVKQYPRESMELVRDLECLPLAIHIAGLMLRKEMQAGLEVKELLQELREEGERLLHEPPPLDMIELIKEAPSPTVAAWLKRSTKLLDSQTRACFVSLGLLASKPATFGRHLSEADKAFACYQKAEVIAEEEKEEDALWRARGNQGLILSDQNCHSESIKLQTEVLNHYQSKNNHRFIGHAHFNLAYSLYRKGDIEMAKIQGAEALRFLVMINDSYVKEVQRQMNTWE